MSFFFFFFGKASLTQSSSWNEHGCAMTRSDEVSGACHKHFRNYQQAQDFLNDWSHTVADLYASQIVYALEDGFQLPNMEFDVMSLFF